MATLEQAMADPSILERMNAPRPGTLLGQPGRAPLQPDEDRHPDRFQPRLLLAQDEAPPARAVGQRPGDPLQRPGRSSATTSSACWAPMPAPSPSGSSPLQVEARLFTDPRVRRRDPEVPLPVQARIPPDLRPGQAAPRRVQRGHRGVRGVPLAGQICRSSPTRSRRSRKTSRTASTSMRPTTWPWPTSSRTTSRMPRTCSARPWTAVREPEPGPEPSATTPCSAGGRTPTWPGSTRP